MMETIKQYTNPFAIASDRKDDLLNISSGRCAPDNVADYLLNVEKNGDKWRDNFIAECSESADKFESTMKTNKILNFKQCNVKKKITAQGKVHEIRMQRDCFGRLLAISQDNETDIEKCLCYPITPVPVSLCHMDGSILKTCKSALLKCFKLERDDGVVPDVLLIDGFALLHTMTDFPQSFGRISTKILSHLTNNRAPQIHILFDRYCKPSIKDYERSLRGQPANEARYNITSPEQTRPSDFLKSYGIQISRENL
ncbi:hypothetical protein QAD02_021124 [Eretmocerus hayati]|uniref:Uncharacterized protein n=1 Tax=Eretmocerus hayati TaxID=131215 RepID=A0ACC2PR97_9HYME|nr:hypothetical protein QAD02_021124 [Eretmocerus hayati]